MMCTRRLDIYSPSMHCILQKFRTLQAANTKLSHAEKQDTLKQLVTEGWLAQTPDRPGCFSIGVRTFLELGQYLTDLDLPETTRNIWQKFL